jgi:branched-subunit amino acid transport protein
MSAGWITVLAVGAATMAIKAAGPVLLGGRQLPAGLLAVVALLPAALLAALVGVLTFAAGERLVVDARLIGVALAAALIWLRTPVLLVVIAAGAATALARALGVGLG